MQSDNQTVTANGDFEVVSIQPTDLAAKQIILLIGAFGGKSRLDAVQRRDAQHRSILQVTSNPG
jgi:hypothetical protein